MHEGAVQLWGMATPVQGTGNCDARNAIPARVQQAGDDGLPFLLPSIPPSSQVTLLSPSDGRFVEGSQHL